MYDFVESLKQTLDSKINAAIIAMYTYVLAKFSISDFAIWSSVLLTWVMITRQILGTVRENRSKKPNADT